MADVRLIDATCLKRTLEENRDDAIRDGKSSLYVEAMSTAIHILNCTPTIDPESLRPVGHWAGQYDGYFDGEPVYDVWECSNCGHIIDDGTDCEDDLPHYCPACGAKMEDDTHDQPHL